MQLALDDGAPYKGAAWRGAGKQHALDGGALKGSGQGAAARRAARLRLEPRSGVSQLSALQSGAGGERSRWRATLSPPIGAPHAGVSQVRRQRGIAIANSFALTLTLSQLLTRSGASAVLRSPTPLRSTTTQRATAGW